MCSLRIKLSFIAPHYLRRFDRCSRCNSIQTRLFLHSKKLDISYIYLLIISIFKNTTLPRPPCCNCNSRCGLGFCVRFVFGLVSVLFLVALDMKRYRQFCLSRENHSFYFSFTFIVSKRLAGWIAQICILDPLSSLHVTSKIFLAWTDFVRKSNLTNALNQLINACFHCKKVTLDALWMLSAANGH